MTKLTIDLGELGAQVATAPDNPLDDIMIQAMSEPEGISIEFAGKNFAIGKRHQLYRRRKWHQARGNTGFDKLLISINDSTLVLRAEPDFIITRNSPDV